jgi:hypothetical protein
LSKQISPAWFLLSLFVLISAAGFLFFNAAFRQGRNNRQVLWAIVQSAVTREDAIAIGNNPQTLLVNDLDSYLAPYHWQREEQMGAAMVYRYQAPDLKVSRPRLMAICEMYTSKFVICDLNQRP